jgi:predicted metalloprotease with PDZ domain
LTGCVSNSGDLNGRIGIRWHPHRGNKIEKVCPHSPAEMAGLKVGDRILNCDHVNGPAYSEIELTIQRENAVLHFVVLRVPENEIDE